MQGFPSYSPPDRVLPYVSVNPRPLRPLERPPVLPSVPNLPCSPRSPPFNDLYSLTTHIVPAAFPRHPSQAAPRIPNAESSQDRKARVLRMRHELMTARHQDYAGTRGDTTSHTNNNNALFNVLNRYRSRTQPPSGTTGVTLIVLHANGFPKEIWEPTLGYLVRDLYQRSAGPVIEEIWTMEAVNHGDSAILNADMLGDTFDWADNARDILNFLTRYLPSSPLSPSLPVHLDSLPEAEVSYRLLHGVKSRAIVGLGHSLGGCSVALTAVHAPSLFRSLVLVDPVISPTAIFDETKNQFVAGRVTSALSRRDKWESRLIRLLLLQSSRSLTAWAVEVLETFVQHGLCCDDTGNGVKLKTPGYQEAVVFSDVRVSRETWELLADLDVAVELFWIMAGKTAEVSGGTYGARQVVWRRSANTQNILVPEAGHLIAQERPKELGHIIGSYLQRKFGKTPMRSKF